MRIGRGRWCATGAAAALLTGLLVVVVTPAHADTNGAIATTPTGTVTGRVEAGGQHTCGIRTTGTVACWGSDADGESSPPPGLYSAVSSGIGFSCGLRSDGLKCWGRDGSGQASPPSGVYRSVAAGYTHACAIRSDGTLACWGANGDGRATPPGGTFLQVSSGNAHTCAIREDGTVACWGDNGSGRATPPSNSFLQVSAGGAFTCGIRYDHQIACWGETAAGQGNVPSGTFRQVTAGYANACAVRADGAVVCWGDNSSGESTPPSGTFSEISARYHHVCGVRTIGTVACWGRNDAGQRTPASGTFSTRTTVIGGIATCGIRVNGTVRCWGGSLVDSPAGTFTQITTTEFNACGIRTSGDAICWGYEAPAAPAGALFDISGGNAHYCGIAGDGTAVCWGNNSFGQTNVVANTYRHVSAGVFGTCAVRSFTGAVVCWGTNTDGQFTPPAGSYASVDAGHDHTCALHASGAVDCFGSDTTTFPSNWGFSRIDAGKASTCGITSFGNLYCWGRPIPHPFGMVTQISVDLGRSRTCAFPLTGWLACEADATANLAAAAPTFSGPDPHVAVLGQPYSYTFGNDGRPGARFAVTAKSLPPGLTLSPATGRISGTPTQLGSFAGVITANNDFFPVERRDFGITVLDYRSVSVGDVETVEPDGDQYIEVPVMLSAPLRTGQVTVHVATVDDTARAGADYESAARDLTWAPGDPLVQNVSVVLHDDPAKETDERFRVVLSQAHGAAIGDVSATVTLRDNDGLFHITAADAAITEGDGGTPQLRYVVALDAHPVAGQTVQVHVATGGGSATAGTDYTAISTDLTWTATDPLIRLVSVPVRGDNVHESDETVTLTITAPAPGALVAVSDGQATGTIVDDD